MVFSWKAVRRLKANRKSSVWVPTGALHAALSHDLRARPPKRLPTVPAVVRDLPVDAVEPRFDPIPLPSPLPPDGIFGRGGFRFSDPYDAFGIVRLPETVGEEEPDSCTAVT